MFIFSFCFNSFSQGCRIFHVKWNGPKCQRRRKSLGQFRSNREVGEGVLFGKYTNKNLGIKWFYTIPDKKDKNKGTAFSVLWKPLNRRKRFWRKIIMHRCAQSMKIDDRKPINIINIIDKNQSINIDWFHLLMKMDFYCNSFWLYRFLLALWLDDFEMNNKK